MTAQENTMSARSILVCFGCAALALSLNACCTTTGNTGPAPNKCNSSGVPNSEVVLSTSCKFVVQTSEMCVYDGAGMLKDVSSKVTGACLCLGTDF